jgi:hypothetical protein
MSADSKHPRDTAITSSRYPLVCGGAELILLNATWIDISHRATNTMSTDPINPPAPEPSAPAEVAPEEALHFDYPGSDIVLRSSDFHNFHVPKLYIVNSSPVLRELIQTISNTSNTPNGEGPESLPVVKLPESGATLHNLLTFISPSIPS